MRSVEEEIRLRFPRVVMSLVMVLIFWIIGIFIPPTVRGFEVPGLNISAELFLWVISMGTAAVFLIRALADSVVLIDITIDIIIKQLGIKDEKLPKKTAREVIYIIVIILVTTAVSPLVAALEKGSTASTVITYVALVLILVFIYDIGRSLYRIVEQKAELLADRLAKAAGKKGG